MDSQLEFLADKYNCVYTRYADDLTFSTRSRSFPDGLAKISNDGSVEIGTELDEVIRNNDFEINQQKIRLQNYKHHQEVTGITVNEEPNVSRSYLRQIRAMIYAWEKFGLENAETEYQSRYNHRHRYKFSGEPLFPQVVRGKIEFVGMIRGKKDPLYLRLLSQYEELISVAKAPVEIQESLQKFRSDHPDSSKNAFIMMQFTDDNSHNQILRSIENLLSNHGLKGLRADHKDYHTDLYFNILTYIYGCSFGIAVFDRISSDDFNPNVSFELGYSLAINKPVCILKDDTHKALQTDLLGKLYKSFSVQNIDGTISKQLLKWLRDQDLISPLTA